MSSQAIGQRFRVSRGCCWQCVADCRTCTFEQGKAALRQIKHGELSLLNPEEAMTEHIRKRAEELAREEARKLVGP